LCTYVLTHLSSDTFNPLNTGTKYCTVLNSQFPGDSLFHSLRKCKEEFSSHFEGKRSRYLITSRISALMALKAGLLFSLDILLISGVFGSDWHLAMAKRTAAGCHFSYSSLQGDTPEESCWRFFQTLPLEARSLVRNPPCGKEVPASSENWFGEAERLQWRRDHAEEEEDDVGRFAALGCLAALLKGDSSEILENWFCSGGGLDTSDVLGGGWRSEIGIGSDGIVVDGAIDHDHSDIGGGDGRSSKILVVGDVAILPSNLLTVSPGLTSVRVTVVVMSAAPPPIVAVKSPADASVASERKFVILKECQALEGAWDEAVTFEIDFEVLSAQNGHENELSFELLINISQGSEEDRDYKLRILRPGKPGNGSTAQEEKNDPMNMGIIAAIALGVLVLVILILFTLHMLTKSSFGRSIFKHKRLQEETNHDQVSMNLEAEEKKEVGAHEIHEVSSHSKEDCNHSFDYGNITTVGAKSEGGKGAFTLPVVPGEIDGKSIDKAFCHPSSLSPSLSFVLPLEERRAASVSESDFSSASLASLPEVSDSFCEDEEQIASFDASAQLDFVLEDKETRKFSSVSNRTDSGGDFEWTKSLPELQTAVAKENFDPEVNFNGSPGLLRLHEGESLAVLQLGVFWTCVRRVVGESDRCQTGFVMTSSLDFK